jgi:hypothetical protein
MGLDIAHSALTFGFSAAKSSTRLGFSVARSLANTTVSLTSTVVDLTLFGGGAVTRPIFGLAVSTVLTLAEQITLAPIHLSEYITITSLLAAHSSINALSVIFPGSSEASFSLVSFIDLVRREWSRQTDNESLPKKQYGITQVARAIAGWVVLQGVTQQWHEQRWLKHLREMDIKEPPKIQDSEMRTHKSSHIRVISDVIFPGQQGPQIIAADIGKPELVRSRASSIYLSRTKSLISLHHNFTTPAADTSPDPPSLTNAEVKATLRRLSKMVLAGYGGASLLFFGVSPSAFGGNSARSSSPTSPPTSFSAAMAREKTMEEANLTSAVDASEAEAAGDGELTSPGNEGPAQEEYSWWDLLLGKHDQEIFERSTAHVDDSLKDRVSSKERNKSNMKATAVIGKEHLMPRFWVLTDHSRAQIVLVIRGTMSLNEIAVDLTCDAETFQPASTPPSRDQDDNPLPGQFAFPSISEKEVSAEETKYHVHGGMLKMAKLMGDVGKPVQLAVLDALHHNPDYELVLCGHSLGAGVAAILGMTWADPRTCLTVKSSGLPVNRRVYVYCFGPPALADAALSRLTNKLIVSIVYSNDVVARLSLGSIRDLKNAAMWLCEANEAGDREGWSAITAHANRWKEGTGSKDDMDWFIAMRKTLEASMQNSNMYPPGRVLWAMRDKDLHQAHQLYPQTPGGKDKLRVFEVLDVEKVFSQLVFARNMLTAHMPHQYDQVLHDLL